ncbi:hypothetical protein F0U59_12360 [Archangium gephyra]|nr:hypothetical protein F0U59_12360 [Archangium gephyra]
MRPARWGGAGGGWRGLGAVRGGDGAGDPGTGRGPLEGPGDRGRNLGPGGGGCGAAGGGALPGAAPGGGADGVGAAHGGGRRPRGGGDGGGGGAAGAGARAEVREATFTGSFRRGVEARNAEAELESVRFRGPQTALYQEAGRVRLRHVSVEGDARWASSSSGARCGSRTSPSPDTSMGSSP